jgi:hypothetical protein
MLESWRLVGVQRGSFPVVRGEALLEVLAMQHIGPAGVVTPIAYSMRFDSSGWMRVPAHDLTLRVAMILMVTRQPLMNSGRH